MKKGIFSLSVFHTREVRLNTGKIGGKEKLSQLRELSNPPLIAPIFCCTVIETRPGKKKKKERKRKKGKGKFQVQVLEGHGVTALAKFQETTKTQ